MKLTVDKVFSLRRIRGTNVTKEKELAGTKYSRNDLPGSARTVGTGEPDSLHDNRAPTRGSPTFMGCCAIGRPDAEKGTRLGQH
jgi:hypothetical protein